MDSFYCLVVLRSSRQRLIKVYKTIKPIIEQLLGRVKSSVKMELVKSVLVYYVVGRRDIDPDVGMSCIVN